MLGGEENDVMATGLVDGDGHLMASTEPRLPQRFSKSLKVLLTTLFSPMTITGRNKGSGCETPGAWNEAVYAKGYGDNILSFYKVRDWGSKP